MIINKKALCLIAEGCTPGVHITNCLSVTYAVLFSDTKLPEHFAEDFVGGDGVGGGGEDGVYVADGGAQVLGE